MSLEKLLERISKDASIKTKNIENTAKKDAEEIVSKAKNTAYAEKKRLSKEAKNNSALKRDSILARARLDARDMLLEKKRKVFEKGFDLASEKLNKISDASYEKFVLQLLLNKSVGNETVIIENSKGQALVDRANGLLAKAGKPAELKLSQKEFNERGFILVDAQNSTTDFTFRALIDFYRKDLEQEVFELIAKEDK